MGEPVALTLASASPRRHQLLTEAGIDFAVALPHVDEDAIGEAVLANGGTPADYVSTLAQAKVQHVSVDGVVLAADTVVVHLGRILGKPKNRNDARATLLGMSDSIVNVITAVAVGGGPGEPTVRVVSTALRVRPLSPADVHRYVATGAADDKAGSLAVQDEAADFISTIEGCFTNVIGLPMCEVRALLDVPNVLSPPVPGPHRASECLCPTAS